MLLLLAAAGCATGEGVGEGARLTVYVSGPLSGPLAASGRADCAGAKRELARQGGRAGSFRLQAVCLDDSARRSPWNLAAVGANARRAVEDSSTIAYIGEPGRVASRFSRPILEPAGIPQVSEAVGATAMREVIRAVRSAGHPETSADLRDAVGRALSGQ